MLSSPQACLRLCYILLLALALWFFLIILRGAVVEGAQPQGCPSGGRDGAGSGTGDAQCFGRAQCVPTQEQIEQACNQPNLQPRRRGEKSPNRPIIKAKDPSPSLALGDDLTADRLPLKAFNNSSSHTSCFYSRRLRPQTPQGSDDEGGESSQYPSPKPPLAGREEPSSPSLTRSSTGNRADKQALRSSLSPDTPKIFLLGSFEESPLFLCIWTPSKKPHN